jgi:chromosome segregation protein
MRAELEQARIQHQEIKVRVQTLEERLEAMERTPQALLSGLEESDDKASWQEKINTAENRIQRLGAINLAAIDEYEQLSERKNYLDSQYGDLSAALETLEQAIHRIDKETRSRFKETFDRLNANLKETFPLLFGGGHAYLEMTAQDLLETGVTVMARPPGKKNSNIHLLSGGEKALTAVALVFSIFKLNPAPFCILDEVDAPLDDNNVGRFSEMVRTMSKDVQFIIITHNKITMEITRQLLGVTMHEAGVSRLVSVDIDEAVEMAASA